MKQYKLLYESSIYDYLIWEPANKLKFIADELDMLNSNPTELYRGMAKRELLYLLKQGRVSSLGKGNTRNIVGSYLASDVKLAARFALVNYRDSNNGILLILNKNILPDLKKVDEGNYVTSYIPKEAIKQVIDLETFSKKYEQLKIDKGTGTEEGL